MIPAKLKIKQNEFMNYLRGKRSSFSVGEIISKTSTEQSPKYAVVISKKVLSKAHERNILKRLCFAIIAEQLEKLQTDKKSIIILFQKKISPEQINNSEYCEQLISEIKKTIS